MASRKTSVRRSKKRTSRDLASALLGGAAGAAIGGAGTYLAISSFRDGKGRLFVLPPHHLPGLKVPRGGSCCANCVYVYHEGRQPHCWEPGFIAWNGGTKLPVKDARDYCTDWWERDPKVPLGVALEEDARTPVKRGR